MPAPVPQHGIVHTFASAKTAGAVGVARRALCPNVWIARDRVGRTTGRSMQFGPPIGPTCDQVRSRRVPEIVGVRAVRFGAAGGVAEAASASAAVGRCRPGHRRKARSGMPMQSSAFGTRVRRRRSKVAQFVERPGPGNDPYEDDWQTLEAQSVSTQQVSSQTGRCVAGAGSAVGAGAGTRAGHGPPERGLDGAHWRRRSSCRRHSG